MRRLDQGFTIASNMRRRILDHDPHNVYGDSIDCKDRSAKETERDKKGKD
jgi:hypothetical protein